jgi:6-phosphogluconolactonase
MSSHWPVWRASYGVKFIQPWAWPQLPVFAAGRPSLLEPETRNRWISFQNRLDMFIIDGDRLAPEPLFRKETLAEPGNIRGWQVAGTACSPRRPYCLRSDRALSTMGEGTGRVFAGGENRLAVFAIDPTTGEPTRSNNVDTRGIHYRTFHIDPSGRLLVAAQIIGLPIRADESIRTVPACLSLFRIGDDRRLDFVRKYDVEVGSQQMFWMGMV